jgi:iron-sulfur cluster assembly protein|tara:strand:- start:2264 stop:2590 length:327 start_codon:yes stop_codon:yes gene_type:complete
MIEITEAAAQQVLKLVDREGGTGKSVRVGVKGGGCSGLTYTLDFAETAEDGDKVFAGPLGVELYVDKKSYLFLYGTILDYSGGLNGKGFEFTNPNATATCGCGSSFSA